MSMTPFHFVFGKRAGFTLLEMMITMSIFILLAAAVFGIITGVLQGSSSLQDNQNHHDQITALNAFLKKKLGELSAQSSFISYRRGDGEGLAQNGIIFGQDDLATAIDAKIQGNGYYTLRLASITPADTASLDSPVVTTLIQMVTTDDATLNWSPLIQDIKTISWKFQAFNTPEWLDLWNNSSTKPNLVEFSMQMAGDLQPVIMDVWIPPLNPVILTLPQTANPPTTNVP